MDLGSVKKNTPVETVSSPTTTARDEEAILTDSDDGSSNHEEQREEQLGPGLRKKLPLQKYTLQRKSQSNTDWRCKAATTHVTGSSLSAMFKEAGVTNLKNEVCCDSTTGSSVNAIAIEDLPSQIPSTAFRSDDTIFSPAYDCSPPASLLLGENTHPSLWPYSPPSTIPGFQRSNLKPFHRALVALFAGRRRRHGITCRQPPPPLSNPFSPPGHLLTTTPSASVSAVVASTPAPGRAPTPARRILPPTGNDVHTTFSHGTTQQLLQVDIDPLSSRHPLTGYAAVRPVPASQREPVEAVRGFDAAGLYHEQPGVETCHDRASHAWPMFYRNGGHSEMFRPRAGAA